MDSPVLALQHDSRKVGGTAFYLKNPVLGHLFAPVDRITLAGRILKLREDGRLGVTNACTTQTFRCSSAINCPNKVSPYR